MLARYGPNKDAAFVFKSTSIVVVIFSWVQVRCIFVGSSVLFETGAWVSEQDEQTNIKIMIIFFIGWNVLEAFVGSNSQCNKPLRIVAFTLNEIS